MSIKKLYNLIEFLEYKIKHCLFVYNLNKLVITTRKEVGGREQCSLKIRSQFEQFSSNSYAHITLLLERDKYASIKK